MTGAGGSGEETDGPTGDKVDVGITEAVKDFLTCENPGKYRKSRVSVSSSLNEKEIGVSISFCNKRIASSGAVSFAIVWIWCENIISAIFTMNSTSFVLRTHFW